MSHEGIAEGSKIFALDFARLNFMLHLRDAAWNDMSNN